MITANSEIVRDIRHNVKAITFDLWGTLFDDTPVQIQSVGFKQMRKDYFRKIVGQYGYEIDNESVDAAYAHAREVFDQHWKKQMAFDAKLGINAMLAYLRIDLPINARNELIIYFEEIVNEVLIRLVEGARELIIDLHKKYKIGLISDTAWTPGRVLEHHLDGHGIRHCFDSLIFSDQNGYCKPASFLFKKAMADLNSTPETTLHVGDLKFTDIRGANQIGCYSAWIHRPNFLENGEAQDEPDITIDSVADLREVLL